jgi:hypothetical protein
MNDIRFEQNVEPGVTLAIVPFGNIVTRTNAPDTAYMVVSLMDGTGLRGLVSLRGGIVKSGLDQQMKVIPRCATLSVRGELFIGEST